MHRPALLAAMQAFASIELMNAIYVACPISSGKRELDLMLECSRFDREALRVDLASRWQSDVLEPNRAAARAAVDYTRSRFPGRSVINPSEFDIDGLDQSGYDTLCDKIIRRHVTHIVLADGWQYSRGARVEAVLAADLSLSLEDGAGNALSWDDVLQKCDEAEASLRRSGFTEERVRDLLPRMRELASA